AAPRLTTLTIPPDPTKPRTASAAADGCGRRCQTRLVFDVVASTPPGLVLAVVLLFFLVGTDAWVYRDAARQRDAGEPVVLVVGALRIETPEEWLIACLLLWIVAFPLYLTGRRN